VSKEKSKIGKKFDSAISPKSFSSPEALAAEYLSGHIRGRKSLKLRRERVFNPKDSDDFQWIKKTFEDRLSLETKETLRKNYENVTRWHITETLRNFEIPILIADKSIELSNEMKRPVQFLRENLLKGIKDIDSLLENEFIKNDESFKDVLLERKRFYEKVLNRFKTVKADEALLTDLYDVFLDPFGSFSDDFFYYPDKEWFEKYIFSQFFLILQQRKGRPYKIFWKALQIIIYELLIVKSPETQKPYIQWAKKLTATIINEFFERWKTPPSYPEGTSGDSATFIYENYGPWNLPILRAKDIDNSLHSSS
jgi:hypothetical protein